MAVLINLEGIDGAGKGTQARSLCQRLEAEGVAAALISFPRYAETLFGQAVADFLNGKFGPLEQVHPLLAAALYAGDRFESRRLLEQAQQDAEVVVLDRYVASNLAHQGARLRGPERAALIDWIERLEHGVFAMPRPDLVILLDMPVAASQTLVARKPPRNYTDRGADLQEADPGHLAEAQDVYRQLAARHAHWRIVDCAPGGAVRSPDDIAQEIWSLVEPRLKRAPR